MVNHILDDVNYLNKKSEFIVPLFYHTYRNIVLRDEKRNKNNDVNDSYMVAYKAVIPILESGHIAFKLLSFFLFELIYYQYLV